MIITIRKLAINLCVVMFLMMVPIQSLFADVPNFGIPQIKYFNRSDYNGGTQNWSISQADNGLLYVANNFGIMEYDGSNWRLLPPANQSITRAVLAVGSRVYIGANDEFGYYEQTDGDDLKYVSLNKKYELNEIGDFWGIFLFNDLVVFQSEKALCLYKPDAEVDVVYARSRIPNAYLVNGMLLVHDELEGLLELRQGRLFKVLGGEKFAGVRLGAILPLPNDEIVIGTMTNGLYKLGSAGIVKWNVPANELLTQNNVFCGTKNGTDLIFGTIQSGVVVVDEQGQVKTIISKDKGLWNNTVLGLFIDSDNNIWAGLDNGIGKIAYNSSVSFIHGYYDLGTGYCLARKDGLVYLGTNQGLYCISEMLFDSPTKGRSDFKRVNGVNGQVWSLFKDNTGNLLCGHNTGVYSVKGLTAKSIGPVSVVGGWSFRYVPNRTDLLLVGTYKGFVVLKLVGGEWQFVNHVEGFLESSRFMEWDSDGGLWVAHGLKGLFKLYFSDDYSKVVTQKRTSDFSGLKADNDMTIAQVNGKPVFVSHSGLYGFDVSKGEFFEHNIAALFEKEQLPFPNMLMQDKFYNIWYFTPHNMGVFRKQEDGTYRHVINPFAPLFGKLVNGFESIFIWDEKSAILGIEDGFAHYMVTERINYESPFAVHIRGFKGADSDITYYVGYKKVDGLSEQTVPHFAFANNAFDVSYSATWFGGGTIEYSTFLEGFDKEWLSWTNVQKRQFTRLPEGEYTFWVKGRNIYGVEAEAICFKFIVNPPWYRTVWAKIFYVVLIMMMLFAFWVIAHRINEKSKRRELLKQQALFKHTEERLTHEALVNEKEMIRLRNEKLNNEMVHKEKELANAAMHVIQKNDFLMKIKEDLLKATSFREYDTILKRINAVVKQIDNDIDNEMHWEVFETHLDQVHEDFLNRLKEKHADLLPRELKLCAYLRMGMSSKEISSLMNVSARAVENNRYKLRKKMGIEQGDNLIEYIMGL